MPRVVRGGEREITQTRFPDLVHQLADELKQSGESGQPFIEEQHFPGTNKLRANVLWDSWEGVPHEERVDIILRAYEIAEGKAFRENIALAVGLTFPEAYEAGMLPYEVIPLVRKDDPVSLEDCYEAMRAEGASLLFPSGKPELRFISESEANASVNRLIGKLPGSEPVWSVVRVRGWNEEISQM